MRQAIGNVLFVGLLYVASACGQPAIERSNPMPNASIEELVTVAEIELADRPNWLCTPLVGDDELANRIDSGEGLSDELWLAALINCGAIEIPERIEEGTALGATMRSPGWLGNAEIRLTPRDEGLRPAVGGKLAPLNCSVGFYELMKSGTEQDLGILPPGENHLVFDIEIERGAPRDFDSYSDDWSRSIFGPDILWRGVLEVDVLVGS